MTSAERAAGLLLGIIVVLSAAVVVGDSRSFAGSIASVLAAATPLVPVACGAAIVIACGELDLSVAGAFSFYGMAILGLTAVGVAPGVAVSFCLAVAVGLGLLIGKAVVDWQVPALVLTLAASLVLTGLALLIDQQLHAAADRWFELQPLERPVAPDMTGPGPITRTLPAESRPPLFESAVPWALLVVGGCEYWRRRTLSGLQHVAVGLNRASAEFAVLPVGAIRKRAFLLSALFCALSAVLFMIGFQRGGWNPRTGAGLELMAIATAVIGGTRASGGVLPPLGVALAVVLWEALGHLQLSLPGVGPEARELAAGLLLGATALAQARARRYGDRG